MANQAALEVDGGNVNWRYVSMVSFVAAIGGLLFGFDTGVIAGTISGVVKDFNLNPWQEGFAVSNLIIACIFGSLAAGPTSDKFGRKKMLIFSGFFGCDQSACDRCWYFDDVYEQLAACGGWCK